MALFTETRLRNRVQNQFYKGGPINESIHQKAGRILSDSFNAQKTVPDTKKYDIFLSHSSSDAELVAGLTLELEYLGYSVYVDWIEDPNLNRSQVTKETALLLQQRMRQSKSLIYAFSENATSSKWMPWELGYFDGIKKTVAVLPISKTDKSDFKGTEYLGIYNYIQIAQIAGQNKTDLWVHESTNTYIQYEHWLTGWQPLQR